jgi:hypothetical protein
MTADEKIVTLIQESKTLTLQKDSARLCAIYAEAATLVDKKEKPKKWARSAFCMGRRLTQQIRTRHWRRTATRWCFLIQLKTGGLGPLAKLASVEVWQHLGKSHLRRVRK